MLKILLSQRKFALIDDEDFNLVNQYRWFADKQRNTYYAIANIRKLSGIRTTVKMHRLIMSAKLGEEIDHEDRNGLNNQKYNLRFCSNMENQHNQRKPKSYNDHKTSSKFKGVSWNKSNNKWKTRIMKNNKSIYIACFISEIEAAKAYNEVAVKYFGKFANLNLV